MKTANSMYARIVTITTKDVKIAAGYSDLTC